jgi:FkbM family methyltransferase
LSTHDNSRVLWDQALIAEPEIYSNRNELAFSQSSAVFKSSFSADGLFAMDLGVLLVRLLGRERAWRLGRKLYMTSRGDVANAIESNGEVALITAVLKAHTAMNDGAGFTAFDVGANIGEWSEAAVNEAAKAGKAIDIHAFEPVPATFETLARRLSGAPQVRRVAMALSNAPGTARMRVVGANAGTNTLNAGDTQGQDIDVTLDTADAYAERGGIAAIHLLKIDAEGHDLEVIRGALPLLRQRRIWVLQFEYNHRWLFARNSLFALFEAIKGTDYTVTRVTPTGLEVYRQWNMELDRFFECNFALVRNDVLPCLPHVTGHFSSSNVYRRDA